MHVLGAPPAFILSQDRTLRPNMWAAEPDRPAMLFADRIHSILVVSASSCWKGMTRLSPYHTLLFRTSLLPSKWYSLLSPGGSIRLRRTSASQYPVLKVRAVRNARCRAAGINNARDPIHRLVVISSSLFLHIYLSNLLGASQTLQPSRRPQSQKIPSPFLYMESPSPLGMPPWSKGLPHWVRSEPFRAPIRSLIYRFAHPCRLARIPLCAAQRLLRR